MKSVIAISLGASIGALLRWYLGNQLNRVFPSVPPGTLAANLVGGYIIGLAVAYFLQAPGLSPAWRLLVVTGFCGGLTTFSTFSIEVMTLLQEGRLAWGMAAVGAHVGGSLVMTYLGIASWKWFQAV